MHIASLKPHAVQRSCHSVTVKTTPLVLCRCLEEQVHFRDILKANSDDLLQLDTFAVRNLIMTAPHSVRVLSAMQVKTAIWPL